MADAPASVRGRARHGNGSPAGARLRLGLAIVVLAGVALAVDRSRSEAPVVRLRGPIARAATLSRADVRSAAWYCPLAAPRRRAAPGDAVILANTAAATVTVELSGVGGGRLRAVRRIRVASGAVVSVAARDAAGVGGNAVVVEPFGSGVVVEHMVLRDAGAAGAATDSPRALAPCATWLGSRWFFPALTTRRAATSVVALLNPFAQSDAVVDIALYTPTGRRTPSALQGLEIARRSRVLVFVGRYADRQAVIGVDVRVRGRARVVGEAAVSVDGGLAVVPGVARAAGRWWLASGTVATARRLVVLNPSDVGADVAVRLVRRGAGPPIPTSVTVDAGALASVDLARLGRAGDASAAVDASGGPPVVVGELVSTAPAGRGTRGGLVSTLATVRAARTWALAALATTAGDRAAVVVFDPARVSVTVIVTAGAVTIRRTVAAGRGASIALPPGVRGPVVVRADGPVVVERVLRGAWGTARSAAVPADR